MSANDYHLVSNWRVLGTVEEVYDIVADATLLDQWWPSAFLDVIELEKGSEDGTGTIARFDTKGYLPYKLHWHLRVTEAHPPEGFSFKVWGDFEGSGSWAFNQNGAWCDITYDWNISVNKGLVRYFSWLARPLFISNHRWAMTRGEESLRLELARRHATSDVARANVPAPPGPSTMPWSVPAGVVASLLGLLMLRRRGKRAD